ncbi:MAG: porin [Terriglobales bacterium]|jgi:uncharacterized coiled-coil protein SlyX
MKIRRTAVAISLFLIFWAFPDLAQQTNGSSKDRQKAGAQTTADEIRELREAIAAQQQQIAAQLELIEQLRNEFHAAQQSMTQKPAETRAANEQAHNTLAAAEALDDARKELALKVESDLSSMRTMIASTNDTAQRANKASAAAMESGFGHIRFNGLLQVWGVAGNAGYKDTFRVRRTELKFSGNIGAKARWTVMIDPSKALSISNAQSSVGSASITSSVNQASRILQDAYITSDYIPRVHVDVGQFKIPLSLESSESSVLLATVERALFMSDRARGGSFGDSRDVGVMISGPLTKYVNFYVGEFNSSGDRQNDVAVNDQKATVGRLVIKPVKWLQLGASGAYGNGGSRPDRPRRDRLGVELLARHHGFTLKSEWMEGKDGNILRQGYYALASYLFKNRFEPVFRLDVFDPDISHTNMSATTTPERDFIAGFNCYLSEMHVKLQGNYMRKTYTHDLLPTRTLLFVNLQTSW